MPGLGKRVIGWIAHGHVIQTSKNRDSYGTGDVHGVLAPESANNAKEGGALIPTILFGIPGSGSMALPLGPLSHLLTLEYPQGALQDHVTLPWPPQ